MTNGFVSLGQALCYLKRSVPFVDEPTFRAMNTAKSMPTDVVLRTALIGSILRNELPHEATLSVMDWHYGHDDRGEQCRTEVMALVLEPTYVIPADLWHVSNVNFYMSYLHLDDWLTGYGIDPNKFEDEPWMRVTDIRVDKSGLQALAASMGNALATASGGRPANMAFWRAFYADIVMRVLEKGKPIDDDAEWRAWTNELRSEYTDVDESQIVKAMRALRGDLSKRGGLKAGFPPSV